MSYPARAEGLVNIIKRWEVTGRTAAVLWDFAFWIHSKEQTAFLYSSRQTFTFCVLLAPMWCIYIVVLIHLQLRRNSISDKSNFHMIENSSIAFYTFDRRMLSSLSFNELLLLLIYVKWSTNLRSLSLKVEVAPFCLKHMNSVLFAFNRG